MNQTNGRTLLFIVHCNKNKVLNDLAPVEYEKIGDRKKLVILLLPDYFDPLTPNDQWGAKLTAIANKYRAALALDEKDRTDLRVL